VANEWVTSEHYAVQLRYRSPRRTLSLSTANREEAAQRARRMYLDLIAGGWELLLKNHRPNQTAGRSPGAQRDAIERSVITFGDYINLLRSKHLIATRTLEGYIPRLRRIVSEINHIAPSRKRYAAKGGRLWRDRVDAVELASVTPEDVRRWKQHAIDKAKDNEPLRRQYTISVNSTMRQARSLFSERKVLRHLPPIPRPHLFEGVEFEPRVDMKFYGAGIDAPTLLRRAIAELDPEELKAFLLGIALGLRRKEADHLGWQSFDFATGTVQVLPTEHYRLKTRESAATLKLDPEFMSLFKGWHAQRRSEYVLESNRSPRSTRYHYYRADETFNRLVRWLRAQGISGDKPFHVLRKIFGSLIVEKHGIFAASAAMRHTNIELTNAYYVDRTVRTTSGLGSVLSGAYVIGLSSPAQAERLPESVGQGKRDRSSDPRG
jgi:integrase